MIASSSVRSGRSCRYFIIAMTDDDAIADHFILTNFCSLNYTFGLDQSNSDDKKDENEPVSEAKTNGERSRSRITRPWTSRARDNTPISAGRL